VPTSWLVPAIEPGTIETLVRRGHVAVHPWEAAITAEQIAECHDAGLLVNGWTCNDPVRFRELASWGIDGICTDIPDVMLDALRNRGG
jgi:glycerophosphoryl diester phosphodiesterase